MLRPLSGAALGALTVEGLRVAGHEVEVSVGHDGTATVTGLPPGMRLVHTEAAATR
ncbi:hypothetical protein [Nonomuraea turkmeniaca]|uniref:hypothetical protein n=1 Tax=Nonomuraea turkmeniaca TaxID=103838 RepID=UPI001476B74C|nr:hypothetical protein [Nonomuraea turkmeniaca]